jgi:hypothetical protein
MTSTSFTTVRNAWKRPRIEDVKALETAGYQVIWRRQLRLIYTAEIRQSEAITDLEWVVDSDFRFFPAIADELFGYILHPVDLAANKVMAAAGRSAIWWMC